MSPGAESGGGGEAAVLSLKINTGTAGADLLAINKALDNLAAPRPQSNVVSKETTAQIKQQGEQIAVLSQQLKAATAELQKFQQGSSGAGPEKMKAGVAALNSTLQGTATSAERTASSFKIMLRSAEMTGSAAVKAANDIARAKNAANNLELRVIRQEEIAKATAAARAARELAAAKNAANNLELKTIRQEEIAKIRAASQAAKELAASKNAANNLELRVIRQEEIAKATAAARAAKELAAAKNAANALELKVIRQEEIARIRAAAQAAKELSAAKNAANALELRVIRQEEIAKATAAAKAARELAAAKNAANTLELRLIRQEEISRARAAAQAAKELAAAKNAANALELRLIRQEELARIKAAQIEMGNLYNRVKATTTGFDAFGTKIAATQALVAKFGEAQTRAFLGKNAFLVDMIPQLDRYKSKIGEAGSATHTMNTAQGLLHSTLRGVSGVLGGLWLTYAKFVPVLLAAAAATKAVKDSFQAGTELNFMSQFVAVTETAGKASVENLRQMRAGIAKELINISRDSVFTTQENAGALQKLALAGIESARGLKLLETASDAAVFGQLKLAEATEMVLDTLYNFNMASYDASIMEENFQRVADIMSYTAVTVNTSFADLAKAFQNITGVAGTFNIKIEEASALLQSLAEAGIRGQKAGTYVRNFLDDVLGAPISQRAEKTFNRLGIERFDPENYGQYGVSQYIDELVEKLKKLDFVEQQNAIRAITNQRSRRVLRQELINSYDEESRLINRVKTLAEEADGSLARMSEKLRDNARYSILMAQSAYNAAVTGGYQDAGADQTYARAGNILQDTFNSRQFSEILTSLNQGMASLAESAAGFFQTLVKYKDVAGAVFSGLGVGIAVAAFLSLDKAILSVFATTSRLWPLMAANPVLAVASAVGIAVAAWNSYAAAKSAALMTKDEVAASEREAAQEQLRALEKQLATQKALAEGDTTGFYDFNISKLESQIAEVKTRLKGAVENELNVNTETLAREIKDFYSNFQDFTTNLRDGIRKQGLSPDQASTAEYEALKAAIGEMEAKQREFLERLQQLRANGAPQEAVKAARQELANAQDTLESAMDALEVNLERDFFSQIPKSIRENWAKGTKELREGVENMKEELAKVQFNEEQSFSIKFVAAEEAATYAASIENAKWQTLALAESVGIATQQLRDEAVQASKTRNEADTLVDTMHRLREAKDFASGRGVLSSGTLLGLDPIQIQGLTEDLRRQTEQIGMTKDKLNELANAEYAAAIATLEHQKAAATVAGTSLDAIAGYQMRIDALKAMQAQQNALFQAQKDQEASRNSTGGGRTGPSEADRVRAQIEEAKTAIQEYENVMNKALSAVNKDQQNLKIGSFEAEARAVNATADAYGKMLTAINEAKGIKGIKDSQLQKLMTEELDMIGKRDEELARIEEEANNRRSANAQKVRDLELKSGRLVLSAQEAWLAEYASNYGEVGADLYNDQRYLQGELTKAEKSGNTERVAVVKAALAKIDAAYDSLAKSAVASLNMIDVEVALKKASLAVDAFKKDIDKAMKADADGGLFGVLFGGTVGNINAAKQKHIANLRQMLADINRELSEVSSSSPEYGKLLADRGKIQEEIEAGLEASSPTLQRWSDEMGSALANALVYGFAEGESPAKMFANMLKKELANTLSSVFSKVFNIGINFVANMVGSMFGMGSSGVAGSAGSVSGGVGGTLNLLSGAQSLYGAVSGGLVSGVAGAIGSLGNTLGSAALTSFSAGMQGATLGAGMAGPTTAGASGAMGAGSMFATALPWIAGGLAIASLLGVFDKKPSNRAAWGEVDLSSGATSGLGNMTGKKQAPQETLDARDAILQSLGAFGSYARADGTVRIDVGGRDGIQAAINGGEMKSYGKDPDKAMMEIMEEILKSSALDDATIARWEELKTAIDGSSRSAADMIDVMGLISGGATDMQIEMAQLMKKENESLGQSYARLAHYLGITKDANEMWTEAQRRLQDSFADLNITMPTSIEGFRELIGSIDLSTEAGQEFYKSIMDLAPAFFELADAVEAVRNTISELADQTIEDMYRMTLSDKEEYAYNDSQIAANREKYAELTNPAEIQANFEKNLKLITDSFNLLPENLQKTLYPQFRSVIEEEERLANERLSVVDPDYTPVVSEETKGVGESSADAVAAAVTSALGPVAALMNGAGNAQLEAANRFNDAVENFPNGIVVQVTGGVNNGVNYA